MKRLRSSILDKDFWLAATLLPSFQGLPVFSTDEIVWMKKNPQSKDFLSALYAEKKRRMIHVKEFFDLQNEWRSNIHARKGLDDNAKNCLKEIYRVLGAPGFGGDDGTDELSSDSA